MDTTGLTLIRHDDPSGPAFVAALYESHYADEHDVNSGYAASAQRAAEELEYESYRRPGMYGDDEFSSW